MTPGTLIDHTTFATRDADEAHDFLAAAFAENRFTIGRPIIGGGQLSIERTAGPRVNVNQVSSPAELEIEFTGRDEVIFSTFHAGEASIDHLGWHGEGLVASGPGDTVVSLQPGVEWVHITKSTHNTAVGVSEALLREAAGADAKDTERHWEPLSTRPIPGREGLWRATTRYIAELFADPMAASAPLVVGAAERVLASAALVVFPNKLVTTLAGPDHEGSAATLARAIAFIDSNPQADISSVDIANAVHSGQRSVELAFRKHLDTTPMAYLRRVRLQHVHEELRASSPEPGVTVASIALRWGFRSQGRFADVYRAEYGEYPSDTLRRD